MDNKNRKNRLVIILLIIIIIIILYFLIRHFGNIVHRENLVPTGNVDIFEIICECDVCNKVEAEVNYNTEVTYKSGNEDIQAFSENDDINKDKTEHGDIVVFDNYKIWDNKELRIFSNPAYEYESKIAPGSYNSYAFVIRNNNTFNVVVDISFIEENEKNINMQYKLSTRGNYVIGNENEYVSFNGKKDITQIKLSAKSQIPYILDWKWVDSDNDTEIGFDLSSHYKLLITVGAN